MIVVTSRFRSALTNDLESRRKRSIFWSLVDLREERKAMRELTGRLGRIA